ncbi:hypothetical protein MMIC_P0770 [Mariprofundus micogutta]|uniref:YgjP-like metallopeptidase domain-containing protein n=1 Tax=Mariprofundus micogutta TaxID=1921010 RepID=A0A1L8CLN1_9PROT|nr:SprT family zinc-dependent metalloprotease [Mariprofundus micogutta]GAV19812.1 hypothetical protein MMIC_P0770 [Mariprofundus micogutta]
MTNTIPLILKPALKLRADMLEYDYRIVRKTNRKTTSIIIKANNEIEVRAPTRMPQQLIERFVQSKHAWIEKKLLFNRDHRTEYIPKSFTHGELFLLLGRTYRLKLETGKRSVQTEADKLLVSHPSPQPENLRRQLTRWYRQQAEITFTQRSRIISELIGKQAKSIGIKAYKSRWGSCHADGRIYYNWRLIMAPEWVIDYVVVHELCHLIHHNHSKAYWQLVESIAPDFRKAKSWLNTNGVSLDL